MEIIYVKTRRSYDGKIVEIADLNSSLYLKSIGFDKPTIFYFVIGDIPYVEKGLHYIKMRDKKINHNNYELHVSAPTKYQVESFLKTKLNNE